MHQYRCKISSAIYCYKEATHSARVCHQTCLRPKKANGAALKKKTSRESRLPATAPMRASQTSVQVERTPPTSNGADVQHNVTYTNIVDIQRYLRWADKAMGSNGAKQGRKGLAPKAA